MPLHLVTGATDGIGKQTALALGRTGATVLVHGRTRAKATAACAELKRAKVAGQFKPVWADLSSLAEVRALATRIKANHRKLDVLVNNAGVCLPERQASADGFEMTMAVNHFSHFVLTSRLLPLLKAAPAARIVNVSSGAHFNALLHLDDLDSSRNGYDGRAAYAVSKLANVLFTHELARRLKGTRVTVNAVHPGIVSTKLSGVSGASVEQGAATSVYCATSSKLAGVSGKYFAQSKRAKVALHARDPQLERAFYEKSCELTGEPPLLSRGRRRAVGRRTSSSHEADFASKSTLSEALFAERLWYLNQVQLQGVCEGQPLDLPFQALLRAAATVYGESPTLEELQAVTGSKRALERYFDRVTAALAKRVPLELRRRLAGDEGRVACWRAFDAGMKRERLGDDCLVSNNYGYGIFARATPQKVKGQLFQHVEDFSRMSVGLSRFYAFNLPEVPEVCFLLEPSIRLLASAMALIGTTGFGDAFHPDWWDVEMITELRALSTDPGSVESLTKLCEAFLVIHELGHAYRIGNSRTVAAVFESAGYQLSDLWSMDFPSENDSNAWARLKGGVGTARDLSFLFGDFLADIAAVEAGVPDDVLKVLRAFVWWLVAPPSPRRRPRGNIMFLRYTEADSFDDVFPRLKRIVETLRSAPHTTAQLMLEWEQESWDVLQQRRPQLARSC